MRFFEYLQWPPPIQFNWLKHIEYWPPRPSLEDLEAMKSICIGTTCRTIGDACMMSTLPRKLKARFPKIKVYTYPRGFNPHVMKHNPYIDGIRYLPDHVYGDGCSAGKGHNIQLVEQFLHLEPSVSPRPELYLSQAEKSFGLEQRKKDSRPVCVIHPWAHTHGDLKIPQWFERFVEKFSDRLQFWQIGVKGEKAIAGCDQYFLLPKRYASVRKMMALMNAGDIFVGLDSGPMHLARAFEKPSLILLNHCKVEEVLHNRRNFPATEKDNQNNAFIYEEDNFIEHSENLEKDLAEGEAFILPTIEAVLRKAL